MNVSFKAYRISDANIYRINQDNSHEPIKASFVELQPVSNFDVNAADKFAELCGQDYEALAQNIAYDLDNMLFDKDRTKRFFAVTRQMCNFDKLDPYEIMGTMETLIDEANQHMIAYLKVAPEYAYADIDRTIKGVGASLIKPLQNKLLLGKRIFADILESAKGFYENMGFQQIKGNRYMYDPKINHSLMRYV